MKVVLVVLSLIQIILAQTNSTTETNEVGDSFIILLFLGLLILTILFGYGLRVLKFPYLHDSGIAIILGCITAALVRFLSSEERLHEAITFDPEVFLLILLPPIIFESGYNMKREFFFGNIGSILTYAFIGTPAATFVTAGLVYLVSSIGWTVRVLSVLDCLIFGALISATDPVSTLSIFSSLHVDRNLYANVFGESVMNDAIAIVMFRTLIKFTTEEFTSLSVLFAILNFFKIFFGSIAIAIAIGVISSLLFKYTTLNKYPTLELILLILYAFTSYLLAEGLLLSGIVSVLFCGMFMGHYTSHNLSKKASAVAKKLFHVIAVIAETFVFTYLGLAIFNYESSKEYDIGLIICSIPIIFIARAVNIFPLSFLINCFKDVNKKIPFKSQIMMWFSGLRGAIAFALALLIPTEAEAEELTTTLIIVVFTVIVLGGLTVPMLKCLEIDMGKEFEDENTGNNEFARSNKFWRFDRTVLIPCLTRKKKLEYEMEDEHPISGDHINLDTLSSHSNIEFSTDSLSV